MTGHDRLTPEGKKFMQQIKELQKLAVRIGYQDDGTMAAERDENGNIVDSEVSLLDVAMFNELGTSNSPSRPFLRQSVDDNAGKISSFCKTQMQRLTKGESAQKVLEDVGVMQKGLVQEKIKSGDFTPNAPSTVKKKKSDKPLIDTGRMRQSVNFIVTEKGGK